MRRWYAQRPGYAAAMGRKHRRRVTEYEKYRYATDESFRLKRRARTMTSAYIRRGKLIRGACEVCGEPNAQAHHDDYTRPLEVRWLCETHHRMHHGELIDV